MRAQSKTASSIAAGALIVGTFITGCSQQETEAEKPDAGVTTSSLKLPTDGSATGSLGSFVQKASHSVTTTGQETLNLADRVARNVWLSVDQVIHSEAFAGTINKAVQTFGEQLKKLESDPSKEPSTQEKITRLGLRQLPVLGSLDRYSDARAKFHHARSLLSSTSPETPEQAELTRLVKEAKRECLLACIQAGLNVSVIGLPDHMDLPFEYGAQLVDFLKLGKTATEVTSLMEKQGWISVSWTEIDHSRLDILTPLIDEALAIESVDAVMDSLLTYDFDDEVIAVR
jgi:hypothetical protein